MDGRINVFAIKDNTASAFTKTFTEASLVDAVRGLKIAVKSGNGQLSNFAEEFDLYLLAEIEQVTGKVTVFEPPKLVTNLGTLKNQEFK